MNVNIGKGLAIDVATERLNREVMDHVIYMGLRNILGDAHAGVNSNTVPKSVNGHTLTDVEWAAEIKAQSRAASEKKLAAMYAGELRAMSERSRVDAVEAEARHMALMALQAKVRAQGKRLNSYSTGQWAAQVTANFPQYMKAAAKVVAMRRETEVELDMGELGL